MFVLMFFPASVNAAEVVRLYPTEDGMTILYDSERQTDWSNARNYQGSFSRQPVTDDVYMAVRSDRQSGYYRFYRLSMVFDTSFIPDDAVLQNVSLNLYKYPFANNHADTDLVLTSHLRDVGGALRAEDWYLQNFTTEFSRGLLSDDRYTSYDLNSSGFDYINLSSKTAIGVLAEFDFDNIPQGASPTGGAFYTSEATDVNVRPYLEITYTVPEEEVTVASGVDKLKEYIAGLVNKAQRNSYTAQVKNILGFFETGKFTAALNQLGALLKKVEVDTAEGQLPPEVTEGITETATAIEEVIEAAATEREVPLMTQIASPYPPESAEWADDVYGDGTPDWCGSTIGGCGCALTSLAMLGQYYGITKGYDGTTVNPGNFNTWLQNNNGYTELNTIRWYYGLQYLSPALGYSTLQLDALNSTNKDEVATAVAAGSPSIAFKKSKGHYFVLSDVLADGNYAVRDPFWYMTQTLNDTKDIAGHVQGYGGTFDQANLYSHTNAQRPFPRWVEIQLGSPAELLITDGQGRRTGYDPETGEILNEIPGSTYAQAAGVVTRDQVGADVHLPKVLAITAPEDDVFTLEVIGTGVGGYTLSVDTGGGYGDSEITAIEDTTTPGQVDAYVIDVPVRQSSDRAVTRLRELADAKEALQPSVAERLREVAERLMSRNVEAVTEDVAAALE